MKKIICIVMCLLMLTGCTRAGQIDKLAFVKILGIDKIEDKIVLTVGIEGTKEKNTVAETECESIFEGISLLEAKSSEDIFFGQIETVLLGNEYADSGIDEALDFFIKSNDMRFDIPVLTVKGGTAKQVIEMGTDEMPVYKQIGKLLDSSRATSASGKVDISRLVSASSDLYSSPYLPYLSVEESITLDGYCLMKDNKVSYFLDENQSRGLNILNNTFEEYSLSFTANGKKVSALIDRIKADIKYENGIFEVAVKCHFKPQSDIEEEDFYKIKECVFERIKVTTEQTVEIMKNNSSDGAGIGKVFHRAKPKEAEKISWRDVFSQITVKVTVSE